jgi:hypothetical protein
MAHAIEIEIPDGLVALELPKGVDHRLQNLLDKQDEGLPLSDDERAEAEGLVKLAESLSLLKLRAKRIDEA